MTCHPASKSQLRFIPFAQIALIFCLIGLVLAGCANSTQAPGFTLPIKIMVDAQTLEQDVPAGSTVQKALETTGVILGQPGPGGPTWFYFHY